VSERAVDALAEIGSKKAVPRLTEMLQTANAKAVPIVVRALGKLGDARLLDTLLPFASRPEREVRIEAIQALSKIVDERPWTVCEPSCKHISPRRTRLSARIAHAAISELENRLSVACRLRDGGGVSTTGPTAAMMPTAVRPLHRRQRGGQNTSDVRGSGRTGVKHAESNSRLDINTLKPATSSRVATSTSIASDAARSAPCC